MCVEPPAASSWSKNVVLAWLPLLSMNKIRLLYSDRKSLSSIIGKLPTVVRSADSVVQDVVGMSRSVPNMRPVVWSWLPTHSPVEQRQVENSRASPEYQDA